MAVTNKALEVPAVVWFVVPHDVEVDGVPDNAARRNVPGNLATVVESDDGRAAGIFSGRIERHRPAIASPGSKLTVERVLVATGIEWVCLRGWHDGEEPTAPIAVAAANNR